MVWSPETVKFSPEPSIVTMSLFRVVCSPASWSGESRPWMTWWVRTAVSCGTSASTALSESAGIASNAGLAGARTVMSCALFSESPRLAAPTAVTSVDSTGLALAAVATGAVAMPSKLPAPEAGTAEQPAPNGWESMASLLGADDDVDIELLLLEPEALSASASDPQAASPSARVAATGRMAPRLRRVLFTGGAPCVRATAEVQHVAG